MTHGGNVWRDEDPGAWLDYSANIRPGGPPDWVREAVARGLGAVSYYPDPGMRRARAALEEFLEVPAGCALPTAGGIAAIDLACRLEADCVAALTPCFGEYAQRARANGKKFLGISLLSGPRALGDPAEMATRRLPPGCAVFLCNPLNPVGAAFSREHVLALFRAVDEARGWLIVDEAFIGYCPERTSLPLLEDHPNLLVAGSATKILGIPGLRLGYLCGQPQALGRLAAYQLTWSLSCFAEAVLAAMPAHRREIRREAELCAARREAFAREIRAAGAFVYPSESAFILADLGREARPVAERLEREGILTRQCMDFDGIDDGRHLRLAVKDESSNRRFLAAFREAMVCGENP